MQYTQCSEERERGERERKGEKQKLKLINVSFIKLNNTQFY